MYLHCLVYYSHILSIHVSAASTLFTWCALWSLHTLLNVLCPSAGCQEYPETETRYVGPRTHTHIFYTNLNTFKTPWNKAHENVYTRSQIRIRSPNPLALGIGSKGGNEKWKGVTWVWQRSKRTGKGRSSSKSWKAVPWPWSASRRVTLSVTEAEEAEGPGNTFSMRWIWIYPYMDISKYGYIKIWIDQYIHISIYMHACT